MINLASIVPSCFVKMSEDPFHQVLQVFFETALAPTSSPVWNGIKSALSSSEEQFPQLYAFLLQNLLEDYNCRLLLKSSHIDLHKNPSNFPSVFVEHYNTSETMGWCWKRWVVPNWPEMDALAPPELGINFSLADVMHTYYYLQQSESLDIF